jgi:hypothetical protein
MCLAMNGHSQWSHQAASTYISADTIEEVLSQKPRRTCWQHAVSFTAHRYLSEPDRVMTFRNEFSQRLGMRHEPNADEFEGARAIENGLSLRDAPGGEYCRKIMQETLA